MLMSMDYIVYLWLLPVTIFILIPLLLLIGWQIVSVLRVMISSLGFIKENDLLATEA